MTYSDNTTTTLEVSCSSNDNLRTSGAATDPADCPDGGTEGEIGVVTSKAMLLFNDFIDGLSPEAQGWINDEANLEINFAVFVHLNENNFSDESEAFAKHAIDVLMVNPDANPFLSADCRSFEYAQPPGALQKGCAVSNFNHTFYTAGVNGISGPYYGEIDINTPIIYFTMPNWMTNGHAANLTAVAVTNTIEATDVFFFENPYVTEYTVRDFFNSTLSAQLAIVGGSYSFTQEPFPIPNPAPYLTSLLGISNPFDCE